MPASEEKPPVPARRDKERKKSKSKDSMQKEFDPNDNQDRQKLLQRRSSADRVILAKNVDDNLELDNPWGDQLGGLVCSISTSIIFYLNPFFDPG